jgi:hypothetical protein
LPSSWFKKFKDKNPRCGLISYSPIRRRTSLAGGIATPSPAAPIAGTRGVALAVGSSIMARVVITVYAITAMSFITTIVTIPSISSIFVVAIIDTPVIT